MSKSCPSLFTKYCAELSISTVVVIVSHPCIPLRCVVDIGKVVQVLSVGSIGSSVLWEIMSSQSRTSFCWISWIKSLPKSSFAASAAAMSSQFSVWDRICSGELSRSSFEMDSSSENEMNTKQKHSEYKSTKPLTADWSEH